MHLDLTEASASLETRSSASVAFVSISANLHVTEQQQTEPQCDVWQLCKQTSRSSQSTAELDHACSDSCCCQQQQWGTSALRPYFTWRCSFDAAASAADCERARLTACACTSAAAANPERSCIFSKAHCRPCCSAASYASCSSMRLNSSSPRLHTNASLWPSTVGSDSWIVKSHLYLCEEWPVRRKAIYESLKHFSVYVNFEACSSFWISLARYKICIHHHLGSTHLVCQEIM